jgi:hypothetical protein
VTPADGLSGGWAAAPLLPAPQMGYQCDPSLLQQLPTAFFSKLRGQLLPQAVVMLAVGLAGLGYADCDGWRSLRAAAQKLLPSMEAKGVAQLVWAFSTARQQVRARCAPRATCHYWLAPHAYWLWGWSKLLDSLLSMPRTAAFINAPARMRSAISPFAPPGRRAVPGGGGAAPSPAGHVGGGRDSGGGQRLHGGRLRGPGPV